MRAVPPAYHRPVGLMGILAILATADACSAVDGSSPLEPPTPAETGNVIAFDGTSAAVTNNAFLVDGSPRGDLGDPEQSLFLEHEVRYLYGRDASNSHAERSWRVNLMDGERSPQLYTLRARDHGEVRVGGEEMERHPVVSGAIHLGYAYRLAPLTQTQHVTGEVHERGAPALAAALDAGSPVPLESTGSLGVQPVHITFRAHPVTRLVGMTSGGPLAFEDQLPRISIRTPLVLEFDRVLAAETTLLTLHPVPHPGQASRGTNGFIYLQLIWPTRRVTIPVSVLQRLHWDLEYSLGVLEVQQQPDVFVISSPTGHTYARPLVQRSRIDVRVGFHDPS